MNVGLLSTDEFLGIKVLQCLGNAEAVVHVLGIDDPKFLHRSRWCRRYVPVRFPDCDNEITELAKFLNEYADDRAIDVFVPSDEVASDYLARIEGQLTSAKCFPVMGKKHYDALHDKWRFAELLTENGIPTPTTRLIADEHDLNRDHLSSIAFPAIVKPLALWGSKGVMKVDDFDRLLSYVRGESANNTLPLIVQEFIPGNDMDLSVLAIEGEVVAWTAQHWIAPGVLEFIENDEMLDLGREIVRSSGHHGVAHFDLRKDSRDGGFKVIECNPRFWFSLPASMWRGVNFVDLGVEWAISGQLRDAQRSYRPGRHYVLEAVLGREFWRLSSLTDFSKHNLRAFLGEISDPGPVIFEEISEWREAIQFRLTALLKPRGRASS